MELMEGRPVSGEGRLPREIRTYDYLDGLGIRYQRTDHERADNMEACNAIDAELSAQIQSARLSFAEPADMLKYLDIEPGAVSIMGLMNDRDHAVHLLIDEDVLKEEYIGCHPCVCTSSLKLRKDDVIQRFLPATGHSFMSVHLTGED